VRRLRKDPDQRLHGITDGRLELEEVLNDPVGAATIIANGIIKTREHLDAGSASRGTSGRVYRRLRLGDLLNYYERTA
jgi:hypothetical protein